MSTEFLAEGDFTSLAVDIEANDPKALMLLWEKTPSGTRVSQTLTRSFSFAEITAFLVMVKAGVDLSLALVDLAKTLRGIKETSPELSFAPSRSIWKQGHRFRTRTAPNHGMGG